MSKPSAHYDPTQLSRRAFLLGGVSLLGLTTLGARLYYLQFIRAEKYRHLAEGNRVKLQILPPSRGIILDRTGKPLAENRKNYRLFLDLEKNPAPLEGLDKLSQLIVLDEGKIKKIRAQLEAFPFGRPVLVKEDLSWDEVVKIEHHAPDMPSVFIEIGERRHYPLAEQTAHVLGYVGAVNEAEKNDFYRWQNAQIGKQGIELALEEKLRGKAGLKHLEVNVRGLVVRELENEPSVAGQIIHSSLHRELQDYIYELLLSKESGAAVVMDAQSGELLALTSAPSFDSNIMSAGIKTADWNTLRNSEKHPLLNKATIGQYPPGSTFKMVTALAGLRKGVMTPQRSVYCPGHFYLGNHRFHCWKPGGHGAVNLTHALAESCDTYFYTIGRDAGIDAIHEAGTLLGFGKSTKLGLPSEKGGVLPNDEWKRKSYNQKWQGGDTINVAIGQGYIIATPMQLALMTARLVNGGRAVQPTLLKTEKEMQPAPLLGLDPAHLQAILTGMEAVINQPFGTAFGARIKEEEMAFAGKTGTAQVRKITIRGQDQNRIPWLQRHHALFVGYAPILNPKFVVSVIVEHGGGGASTAAPVARDILLKTQQLMGV